MGGHRCRYDGDYRGSSGRSGGLCASAAADVDQEGGESVMFYQTDLELVDLQSHRKLWIGGKKIKKFVERDAIKL